MFRRTIIGIAVFLAAGFVLAQVYRWVDADGQVHYSDQPGPGAEEVELESAPAIRMPLPSRRTAAPPAPARETEKDARPRYESLGFASPTAEQTLWNIGGVLDVTLNLQPALQQGHQVRVYLDGNPVTVNGTRFQLQEVYRGAHNLQAEVLDRSGELLIRSDPIRFYVQQTTILNPRGG
jgi:hypothetical protein